LATREDMSGTTMRLTKRTVRYVEFLRGLLKVRTGKDYSLDDVVWEALVKMYPEEIKYAGGDTSSDEDKSDK
jgi:hypothetical protein